MKPTLWIILLFLLGATGSYLLIPSQEEIASNALKSNHLRQAKDYYETQFNQGNSNPDIIIPLVELYEKQGKIDLAITLLEGYVKQHPKDLPALRKLGDLYIRNQNYDAYFQTLLQFRKQHPTVNEEVMRELANWYENQDNTPAFFETLQTLVQSGKADEGDYLNLSYLYAAKKEYPQALKLLKNRRDVFSKKVTINDILFEVWLDVQEGQDKQAVQLTADWLKEQNSDAQTLYILGVFRGAYPSLTNSLITNLDPSLTKSVSVQMALLELLWDQPNERTFVFNKLRELSASGVNDPRLQNLEFVVYLDFDDETQLLQLMSSLQAGTIEERSIIDLSIVALQSDRPFLAKRMQEALGDDELRKNTIVQISLAIASQDPDARKELDKLIRKNNLIPLDRYYLLRVAGAAHFKEETLELGASLFPYTGMQDFELINIALAYIQVQGSSTLYPLIQASSATIGAQNVGMITALLDLSVGKSKKAAEWLASKPHLDDLTYGAFYSLAEEKKEYPLALYVAKQRARDFPSSRAQADYDLALVQMGKWKTGIHSLQTLYKENLTDSSIEKSYFHALVIAAKYDPSYRDSLRKFMILRENKPPFPKDLQRDFGYAYLDTLHDFKRAEAVFTKLAEEKSAQNTDIQTLIYLWGPHPEPEQIQWVKNKARSAPADELGNWLDALLYEEQFDTVIQIYQENPSSSQNPKVYFAYLQALSEKKDKIQLRKEVESPTEKWQDIDSLKTLALYAEQAQSTQTSALLWKKMTSLYPDSLLAWQNLGRVLANAGDYKGAIFAYETFFTKRAQTGPDEEIESKLYESWYYYAVAEQKQEHFRKANELFARSLEEIRSSRHPSISMLQYKALILYQQQEKKEALSLLKTLYEQSGRDPDVTALYANMLMDEGKLQKADNLLGHPKCHREAHAP